MLDISLTFPTPDGSQEIVIDRDRITLGRGTDADQRFADNSLSRVHASIYREGDRVWIVDEHSSNGTFVNGEAVNPSGTPLKNGDSIRLGNETILRVHAEERAAPAAAVTPPAERSKVTVASASPASILPVALIAFAFLIFSVSGFLIVYKALGIGKPEVVRDDTDLDDVDERPTPKPSMKTNSKEDKPARNSAEFTSPTPGPSPEASQTTAISTQPSGKNYLAMSETEKRQYLSDRAMRIAQVIGNRGSEEIPSAALDKIKSFTDAYAKRINVKPLGGCKFGDNLEVTYARASKNAPFIVKAFNEKGIDPRIGLYLAMIESEHCVCLQSPTGPLGMFQFTKATGEIHGLKTVKGASPTNPDERCEPEPSAKAAASYMKALTGRYGTGPASVPLAIGSYNSGEGGLSSNLTKALESNSGLPRDFWSLISKGDILSKQFQSENFKYVPKFFAAAIVGENPQDFGMKLQPISTYTR